MKRRIITILLVAALCIALTSVTNAEDRGVVRFERVIEPQYEDARNFVEGLAAVKKDGKWGFIDEDNRTVIPFEFDYACYFNEGYAVVGRFGTETFKNWRYNETTGGYDEYDAIPIILGCIDRTGNFMTFRYNWSETEHVFFDSEDFNYTQMYGYYGGFVRVAGSVFDTNGNQFRTSDMGNYQAGYVPTQGLLAGRIMEWTHGVEAFWLDMNGDIAIDLRGVRYLDSNMNLFADTTGSDWVSVDWERVRYSNFYFNPRPFNQGLAMLGETTVDMESGDEIWSYGFVDTEGRWVIQPQFTDFWVSDLDGEYRIFNDGGLASVQRDGMFGAIDRTGETVIPFRYDELRLFWEGAAAFRRGDLFGYVDIEGNEVISPRFRETSGFGNGFAVAYDGAKAFLIDRAGNEIPGSDVVNLSNYITQQKDGRTIVRTPGEYVTIEEGGKYGFGKLSYMPPLPAPSEMDGWAYEEVIAAIESDLVPVPLQNMFRSNITRGDFSRLIVHALGAMLDTELDDLVMRQTDRNLDAWVSDSRFNDTVNRNVVAAEALGVVRGYDEGGGVFTFRPYNTISREEAAVMLWRAARVLGMDTTTVPPVSDFTDRGNLNTWSVAEVDFVYAKGVMRGVGETFDPVGTYTRQQSFMTIYRLLEAMAAE